MPVIDHRPIVYDLCCGSGGWTCGLLRAGFHVVAVDVRRDFRLPKCADLTFVECDILNFYPRTAGTPLPAVRLVASPPCTEFSIARFPKIEKPDLRLVLACFRIADELAVPIVLENVHGLQKFLGAAKVHFGKFYLWGSGCPSIIPKGPRWKDVQKMKHRSPMLRGRIPDDLADAVAHHFLNQISAPQLY